MSHLGFDEITTLSADSELPKVLARIHPKTAVPHVGILASRFISIAVALLPVNHLKILTSMMNVGALTAFVMVNLAVIVLFRVRRKSPRWMQHLVLPAVGILSLLAVMSQMSRTAVISGVIWLAIGFASYFYRRSRPGYVPGSAMAILGNEASWDAPQSKGST